MRYAIVIERAVGNHSAYVPALSGGAATGDTLQEVGGEIRDGIAFHLNGLREDGVLVPQPSALLSRWKSPRDASAKRSIDWLRANTFEGRSLFPGPRSRRNHWQHAHRDKRKDLTPPRRPHAFGELFKEPSWRPRNAVGNDAIVGLFSERSHAVPLCFRWNFLYVCTCIKHFDAKLCVNWVCDITLAFLGGHIGQLQVLWKSGRVF